MASRPPGRSASTESSAWSSSELGARRTRVWGSIYLRSRILLTGLSGSLVVAVWLGRGKALLTIPLGYGRIYCDAEMDRSDQTDPTGGDPAIFGELYREFAIRSRRS